MDSGTRSTQDSIAPASINRSLRPGTPTRRHDDDIDVTTASWQNSPFLLAAIVFLEASTQHVDSRSQRPRGNGRGVALAGQGTLQSAPVCVMAQGAEESRACWCSTCRACRSQPCRGRLGAATQLFQECRRRLEDGPRNFEFVLSWSDSGSGTRHDCCSFRLPTCFATPCHGWRSRFLVSARFVA